MFKLRRRKPATLVQEQFTINGPAHFVRDTIALLKDGGIITTENANKPGQFKVIEAPGKCEDCGDDRQLQRAADGRWLCVGCSQTIMCET